MPYSDLLPDIREALGVTSAHDASITRGITRAAQHLLRNYNFRESIRVAIDSVELGLSSISIPADAGKIKAIRLRALSAGAYVYRRLRRREEGQLPQRAEVGPRYYWVENGLIRLDTAMPQEGHQYELWYQSIDPVYMETFLSTTYADVLLHRVVYELAPTKRKPEAMQVYSALWQEDMAVLANYLQELEFGDLEMRMGGDEYSPSLERYPAL